MTLLVKLSVLALVSAQIQRPQFLLPFLGPHNWTEFTPPTGRSISAIVLAEMAMNNAVPSLGVADFNQLMLAAASRLVEPPLLISAKPRLPGFSFLAPNKTASSTTSAKKAYHTSSVSYTHTKDGEKLITSLVINGVAINGTFQGQDSPFLPSTSYLPSAPSNNKSYTQLLGDSLWFYEQQRSGLLHKPSRVEWRNSSALHDGIDRGVDLTGGYFDAGDYIKCTLTLSATLSYMAYGASEHVQSFVDAQQLGYLDQTLRWGLDWLIKAHPQPHRLYVHIGNTTLDNSYWGNDQHIPEPRPVYEINPDSPGTDAAAGTAAAFAAGAVLYATALNDTSYAQILLDHASDLFFFAESAKKTLYQLSVPQVASAYSSSDYGDELVWAALLMFRATADPYYLDRADHYARHYSLADQAIGNPIDWDSKHGIALLLGAQLTIEGAELSYDYVGGLERYVDSLLSQHKTPGGLLWFSGSSDDSSLVQAIDSAYLLFAYSSLPNASLPRAKQATLLAQKQLDYVLGNNPAKRVYITGATPASPKNPQSAMASGGRPGQDMDSSPVNEAHVLYGALVGGPDDQDQYEDKRSNFRQSEVAVDYGALLIPLLAIKAGQNDLPFYVNM